MCLCAVNIIEIITKNSHRKSLRQTFVVASRAVKQSRVRLVFKVES